MRSKTDYYSKKYAHLYMSLAEQCAIQSVAERRKVGCVILLPCGALAHGWNGMPSGSESEICEIDGITNPCVIHAEDNALRKVVGSDTRGSVAFVTLSPCVPCAEKLIGAGVSRVVYRDDYRCMKGVELLRGKEVEVVKINCD